MIINYSASSYSHSNNNQYDYILTGITNSNGLARLYIDNNNVLRAESYVTGTALDNNSSVMITNHKSRGMLIASGRNAGIMTSIDNGVSWIQRVSYGTYITPYGLAYDETDNTYIQSRNINYGQYDCFDYNFTTYTTFNATIAGYPNTNINYVCINVSGYYIFWRWNTSQTTAKPRWYRKSDGATGDIETIVDNNYFRGKGIRNGNITHVLGRLPMTITFDANNIPVLNVGTDVLSDVSGNSEFLSSDGYFESARGYIPVYGINPDNTIAFSYLSGSEYQDITFEINNKVYMPIRNSNNYYVRDIGTITPRIETSPDTFPQYMGYIETYN